MKILPSGPLKRKEKMKYTRKVLIELCKKAVVPHQRWSNRDASSAQRQVGELFMLLSANCPFEIITVGNWKTDKNTIVIEISFHGFSSFESGRKYLEKETFYLPTQKRLDESKDEDWY